MDAISSERDAMYRSYGIVSSVMGNNAPYHCTFTLIRLTGLGARLVVRECDGSYDSVDDGHGAAQRVAQEMVDSILDDARVAITG